VDATPAQKRRTALHAASHIARRYPEPYDEALPHVARRNTARDPQARHELREVLDALGLLHQP